MEAELREENSRLRAELDALKQRLSVQPESQHSTAPPSGGGTAYHAAHNLSGAQISRYSRQLLLSSFGVEGQSKLCNGSVLVIGAGGLGSPALQYLAGAGVGRIGIADKDTVEISNLHRQVIHNEETVGIHKCDSAARACRSLNSTVVIDVHSEGIHKDNATGLVRSYDCVLDCSDNSSTRYLVSDACVCAGRPLVSGAAIGTDGQLTVYNFGEDGPCYRCLFPVAPRPENCSRCSDAGVLGVVPGVIGTLQALEAIKILSSKGDVLTKKLLVFDAMSGAFRTMKLRGRKVDCPRCGPEATSPLPPPEALDYEAFTGMPPSEEVACGLSLLSAEHRIPAAKLQEMCRSGDRILLVDVRPAHEYDIAAIPGSLNVPLQELDQRVGEIGSVSAMGHKVVVVCRRGNDSQLAVQKLHATGLVGAVDVVNGLAAWHRLADPKFPAY